VSTLIDQFPGRLPGGLRLSRALWVMWRFDRWTDRPPADMDDGLTVDPADQPELFALIGDVADRLDAAPDRVVLVGHTEFRAWIGIGGRVLVLGLPLLLGLSTGELSALIAHELAVSVLPRPAVTARLRQTRAAAVMRTTSSRPLRRRVTRACERLLQATQSFADAVEDRADAAAADVAGAAVAAVALAKAALIDADLEHTVMQVEDQVSENLGDVGVADIHDVWRTRLRHGRTLPLSWIDLAHTMPSREHPRLAALIAAVSTTDLDLTRPVQAVTLETLSAEDRRVLAGHVSFNRARWMDIGEMPERVWRTAIEKRGAKLTADVAKVLGHHPGSVAEVVDTLATRQPDLDALNHTGPADPDTMRDEAVEDLLAFAEFEFVRQGWRRMTPGVEGLMVRSDRSDLDLLPLVRRAASAASARSELVTVLQG
jgi:hypothetical protein